MNTDTSRIEQLRATVDSLEQQLAKQAEIIEKLKDFIKETSHIVNDWNEANVTGEFLYEVEQLETEYKGKE